MQRVLTLYLRKLDAFDRRQNLNVEYLKNVFLKFCQAENKEVNNCCICSDNTSIQQN